MNTTYEYINEASIDPEMICSICQSPFIDPQHTPCDETFCRECITNWIQTQNGSCPLCRKPLSVNVLTPTSRMVRNMLDRLPVKCKACGQAELQRGHFDDHVHKVCPKAVVSCSAADIRCPWRGQRDQLNQHLVDCRFELMRPAITQFIIENQQLNDQVNRQTIQITGQRNQIRQLQEQVNQQTIEITGQQNEIRQLKEQVNQQTIQITGQQNEIRQLKEQVNQQRTQIYGHQNENQHLNEQLRQKDTQIAYMNSLLRE